MTCDCDEGIQQEEAATTTKTEPFLRTIVFGSDMSSRLMIAPPRRTVPVKSAATAVSKSAW
jgi:hypothetical protein